MNSASFNFAGAGVMLSELGYDELWAAEEQPEDADKPTEDDDGRAE